MEWVGKLVLLTATPLLLTEGRQTVTRYKSMVRANNQPVLPAFPPRQRQSLRYYYSDTESDEDLLGNIPSIASSRASSVRGELAQMIGNMYPNIPSFSDTFIYCRLTMVIPKVLA